MNSIEIEMVESSTKLIFKIEGMCCATEAESLKQALNPMIGKEATIAFDLINGKLILEGAKLVSKEQIIKVVGKTGMSATLWQDHVEQADKATFWQRHGPIIMNLISLATLITGLVIHIVKMSASEAFGGGVGGEEVERPENPPIATMVVYPISILTGGYLIIPKAYKSARRLRPDPNFLMTLATIGAVAMNHWFEATSSMYLFSLAGLIENWNMGRARKALRKLMELAPATAQVLGDDGNITQQPVEEIPVDAIIVIKPGEKIPMDSTLISGSTSVNQAPITGESMPVQKEIGDMLFAGTINGDGSIQCRVLKAASDSTLANIIKKVEEAQSRRGTSEQWIEKFCRYYVPLVMITSILVIIIPPLASEDRSDSSTWYPWIYKGLQIFVISCPCSLVISTPVCIVAALTAAARSGILIKGGSYLELAAYIKAFAMDKTGTLTNGEPVVQNIVPLSDLTEEALLKLAVALEDHSDHPLARAIQRRAKIDRIAYKPAEGFQVVKGKGGEGEIDGKLFWIGSHRFLHEKIGDNEEKSVHQKIEEFEAAGHSIVAVGEGQKICGFIQHSRNTLMIIKQNVVFSLAIKAVFTGLIFADLTTLWLSMLADIGATFIVVSNSLRLVQRKHVSTKQIQAAKRSQIEKLSTAHSIPSAHSLPPAHKHLDLEAGSSGSHSPCEEKHSHSHSHGACGDKHSHSHAPSEKSHSHSHTHSHVGCGDKHSHSHAHSHQHPKPKAKTQCCSHKH